MTLDEAIVYYRALGESKCEAGRNKYRSGKLDLQFAEWLEDVKAIREAEGKNLLFFKESGDIWAMLHEINHNADKKLFTRLLDGTV